MYKAIVSVSLMFLFLLTNNIYAKSKNEKKVCKNYHNFIKQGVPKVPLKQAFLFFIKNKTLFKKQNIIAIADYSQNSKKKRFYRLNLKTGKVKKDFVSHGSGHQKGKKWGDINHDGMIDMSKYKGKRNNMTRVGFFKVSEPYMSIGSNGSHLDKRNKQGVLIRGWPLLSKNTNALRMDGLTAGVNNKARSRGVVMHGAWHNNSSVTKIKQMGRSYGCHALAPNKSKEILNELKNGSMFYSYVPVCRDDMVVFLKQVEDWEGMCE